MIQVHISVRDLQRGHLGSPEVTNRFLLISHDWKQLETGVWSHYACLITTNRLICNMTFLVQHVTSRDLDLRSDIDLTVQSQNQPICCYIPICYLYIFMPPRTYNTRLDQRNMMVLKLCCYHSLFKSCLKKKLFCEKQLFWPFFYLKRLNYWR